MTVKLLSLPPVAGVAASIAYLASQYSSLPEHYAAHWNLSGQVDRWGQKDWFSVAVPGFMGVAVTVLLAFEASALASRGRVGRRRARAMLAIEWAVGAMMTMVTLLPVMGVMPGRGALAMITLPAAAMAAALLAMPGERSGAACQAPECWKLGLFYYNPDDPDWVVTKRGGLGCTFNFARRKSQWFMGVVLLLILAPLALALRG